MNFETHAQSFAAGVSSPKKKSSYSGCGLGSVCSCSSEGSSSATDVSWISLLVLNWFAVFVLACAVVMFPKANLALLVDPCP